MTYSKQDFKMNKNKCIFIAALSGLLSALSFNISCLWFIIFFSVAPVFYIIIKYKCNTQLVLFNFIFIFYCISDIWILSIGINYFDNKYLGTLISIILLFIISILMSIIFIFPFTIYKNTNNNFTNILILCFIYVFGEWLQGQFIPFAFPWNRLCNIVVKDINFIQSASILGGLFITFLIILINFMIACIFIYKNKKSYIFLSFAIIIYFINSFIGRIIINDTININEPEKVLLVQGNFSKKEKWNSTPEEILNKYLKLTDKNLENSIKLVIYPETALSGCLFENSLFKEKLFEYCHEKNITILFGAQYNEDEHRYNACAAAYPDKQYSKIYFKQILVPFGEYNPFFSESNIQFTSSTFTKGDESILIETEIGKLGCGICFESIFPELISKNSVLGAEAIVILTNDSWLGKRIPLYQHHSHSILRAVENKKYIINCTNTGISSVISANGKVIKKTDVNCSDTISADIYTNSNITFYAKYGDLIIIPASFIILWLCLKTIYIKIFEIITFARSRNIVE